MIRPSPWYNPRNVAQGTVALADRLNDEMAKIQAAFDLLPAPTAINQTGNIVGFTWLAFADSDDGSENFTTGDPGERAFVGYAFNKTVEAPSQFFVDYKWQRVRGNPGARGAGFSVQYSVDGIGNWHFPYAAGDRFQRQSVDDGLTYSAAARIAAATLAELDVAASNALAAAGTDIVALQVQSGALSSAISSEASLRLTNDNALAAQLTTVTATVNANNANVTSQFSAQASTNAATASTLGTVTTTLAGNTASISSFQTSINGLLTKVGVTLNVNGLISGFALNNNGKVGDAIFDVDKFGLGRTGADGMRPFEFIGGEIFIKSATIGNLTIGTTKLANNATFAASVFYADFNGFRRASVLTNTWYDIVDGFGNVAMVAVTTGSDATQRVTLSAILTLARDGGDDDNMAFRVVRSDNVALPQVYNNVQIASGRRNYPFAFYDDKAPVAQTVSYRLQFLSIPNDGHPFYYNVSLQALVNKK